MAYVVIKYKPLPRVRIIDSTQKCGSAFAHPPSLQALLDLLEPYFSPLLDDLLDDVESGRTWTLGQVPEAVAKLNSNIMDIAHLIPPSFYRVSISHSREKEIVGFGISIMCITVSSIQKPNS